MKFDKKKRKKENYNLTILTIYNNNVYTHNDHYTILAFVHFITITFIQRDFTNSDRIRIDEVK